jgi:cytochrome c553
MKWTIRISLGLPLLLGGALLVSVFLTGRRLAARYDVNVATAPIPTDEASRTRGEHLGRAVAICTNCHGADLGGQVQLDRALIGRVASPNLTSGNGSAVRDYSAEDWFRAVRHGVRPDGTAIMLMPAGDFDGLSNEEVAMMVAWLQSLPPVDRDVAPSRHGPGMSLRYILGQMPGLIPAESLDHVRAFAHRASERGTGERFATTCTGCHGPNLSGGPMLGAPPGTPEPSNLTRHPTGLQQWTERDFTRALREHVSKDGRQLHQFMPRAYASMGDADVAAVWAYLSTLPPKARGER